MSSSEPRAHAGNTSLHWPSHAGRALGRPSPQPPDQASTSFSATPNGSHTAGPFLEGKPFCMAPVTWVPECHRFSRARPLLEHPIPSTLTTPFSRSVPRNSLCGLLTSCRERGDHKPVVGGWIRARWSCQVQFLSAAPGSDQAWFP